MATMVRWTLSPSSRRRSRTAMDALVVVTLGWTIQRPGAEILAATAAWPGTRRSRHRATPLGGRPGSGYDDTAAVCGDRASGSPDRDGSLRAQRDNANNRLKHGLCSWSTEVTHRCSRTQAVSFNPLYTYVVFSPESWWGSARILESSDDFHPTAPPPDRPSSPAAAASSARP